MRRTPEEIRRIKEANEKHDDALSLEEMIEIEEANQPDRCETCKQRHADTMPCGVSSSRRDRI